MPSLKLFILLIHFGLYNLLCGPLASQRYSCTGESLIATHVGSSTHISRPLYIPFSTPFLSPIASYANIQLDAIGFNSSDHFLYGVKMESNEIIRLKRNNQTELVGNYLSSDTIYSNAGDCHPNGQFLIHDYRLNEILVFEVEDEFSYVRAIDLYWDPEADVEGDFQIRLFDLVIDPFNPSYAYSYQSVGKDLSLGPESTQGSILQINIDYDDLELGKVTPISQTDTDRIKHIGGLMFSPLGQLTAYGTAEEGLNAEQEQFYGINIFSGETVDLNINNIGSDISDGCSCPYSLSFTCLVPDDGMYCNDDVKKVFLTISNNGLLPLENITLRDTMPEGMIIENISDNIDGVIEEGTGIGSDMLVIKNFNIAARSELEITIWLRSVDAPVGNTYYQAFLYDLPPKYGEVYASDNVWTVGEQGDPSLFVVTPRRLDDVQWEVISPTDCLEADDGQIIVSSPQFFEGTEYEIKILNRIGYAEYTYEVTIDENSAFTLDSLYPGNYQLFQLRSLKDNCSLAVKDTLIYLEAPNDLLQLTIESNSPICFGDDIQLQSQLEPEGGLRWTGPDLYGSEDINPIIEDATLINSGEYTVLATYGYCSQTRNLDVEVKEEIDASIEGKTEYCQRDTLSLAAIAGGEQLSYRWSGPSTSEAVDSILNIVDITDIHDGTYQVIIDNTACQDTASWDVLVLPTPTLTLDSELYSEFCDPVYLTPEVSGDNNVTYQWQPATGLSCSDCLEPELRYVVQPRYQLNVENQYMCSDSAEIDIQLNTERMAYAPNVFSVNGQKENDRFTLYPGCVTQDILLLKIFDRWGNMVYDQGLNGDTNTLSFWDGQLNGIRLSSGVYTWIAELRLIDGTKRELSGSITFL